MHILNCCVVQQDSILQTGVCASQSNTFYAPLLVVNERSARLDFSVVNCSVAVMSVIYSPVLTRSLIFFAIMNCCVVVLSLFSSDIVTWSADSLYSVQ